ncbi:LysR family transcriptional regulator substrate-binding protein [Kitasatospora sp. NPDC056783]|uniref:LysR family transcriptional regulator substrate-binding protein n=1 Tax=Kitasatospora sp. NPDC056783 TaxID=3345943 RepID=UPI003691A536
MSDSAPATAPAATRPIRFGIHGSPHLAESIIAAAGTDRATIELVPYDVREPFRPLREGAMDLMIVKYDLYEPDIAAGATVAHDPRAVIVGAHHPLAGRPSVSIEETTAYEAFSCPGDFPPYVWDLMVPPRTPAGTPIRRVHPMTTVEAMAAVLAETRAVHLSVRSLEDIVPPNIRVVPIHDLPAAPVTLAWLRGAELSPEAAAFVAAAERSAKP